MGKARSIGASDLTRSSSSKKAVRPDADASPKPRGAAHAAISASAVEASRAFCGLADASRLTVSRRTAPSSSAAHVGSARRGGHSVCSCSATSDEHEPMPNSTTRLSALTLDV